MSNGWSVFEAKSIFPAYPTVGYVKAQELFRRYPEAKKNLQALEAKKAALQVGKWKKDVDKLAEDASNITLQNEALVLQASLATFADLLATKVP